jgi:hypothetical protein
LADFPHLALYHVVKLFFCTVADRFERRRAAGAGSLNASASAKPDKNSQ